MLRWIVSLSALIAVASAFAGPSYNGNNNHNSLGILGGENPNDGGFYSVGGSNSFCNPTPTNCDPNPKDCNPKPPTNCVPEPTSMAALAIGGFGFIRRKKKNQA